LGAQRREGKANKDMLYNIMRRKQTNLKKRILYHGKKKREKKIKKKEQGGVLEIGERGERRKWDMSNGPV